MTTNIIENFKLEEHLLDCEIITEEDQFGDIWRHKEKRLSDELTLHLYDSGQANLVYKADSSWDNTFLWDSEAAAMIENIEYVTAIELFELMYRKRLDRS